MSEACGTPVDSDVASSMFSDASRHDARRHCSEQAPASGPASRRCAPLDDAGTQALWARIQAHRLDDPGASLVFSHRLAREQGWSRARTLRCIEEYRRFVMLASVAEHTVVPSEDVDRVWHLHLTYTRDYWNVLCAQVLGFALHHNPTEGGPDAHRRHRLQYL